MSQPLNVELWPTTTEGSANDSLVVTTLPPPPELTSGVIVRSSILVVMSLLSAVANTWTIRNIKRSRVAKKLSLKNYTAIYLLIFHLCVADLLVTSFCMLGNAIWGLTVQFLAPNFMCKAIKFLQMFSLYLSTYLLVLIGLDRLMAVKYPMKIMNMGHQSKRSIICVYSLSVLFSLPQIFIFRVETGPFAGEEFLQCVTHGFYTEHFYEQLYTTLTLLIMFIVPLVILIGSYLLTVNALTSSEKKFLTEPVVTTVQNGHQRTIEQVGEMVRASYMNRQKLLQTAKYNSLRMSVIIIVAFIICWTPYYVMMIVVIYTNAEQKTIDSLESIIFFFGMSNSLVNPIIYGLFHLIPKRRKFFNSFQHSQTRTGIAVGEVSHSLIASNKKLISRIGSVE